MGAPEKITLSVIKADAGGWVGHCTSHPDMLALAAGLMKGAVERGLLVDGQVLHCGDDVELIMTHHRGEEDAEINHTPINAQGEPMTDDKDPELAGLTRRIVGVGALDLRERAAREDRFVVAVAGGLEKTEAIRACLKGRYFNVLITDAYVAEALVQG